MNDIIQLIIILCFVVGFVTAAFFDSRHVYQRGYDKGYQDGKDDSE